MIDAKWDRRFLALAEHISSWSKDPSTKCGAVLVRPDKSVVSVGFNGLPSCVPDSPAVLYNRDKKYEQIIHAEMNALLYAKHEWITREHVMYTHPFAPCLRCCVHLLQAGVYRFVFPQCQNARWTRECSQTAKLIRAMNGEAEIIN